MYDAPGWQRRRHRGDLPGVKVIFSVRLLKHAHTCTECGAALAGKRWDALTCGHRCAVDRQHRLISERIWARTPQACAQCGKTLFGRRMQTRWCNTNCENKWRYHNVPGVRERVIARARARRAERRVA